MGICYIVAAGDMTESFPQHEKEDLLIAADAGYMHLKKIGIEPDILLGDFDSMNLPEGKEALVYPVMKDDTDTMLAIKLGFEKGYTEFMIYGGLGGERTDHSVANIQSLAYIAEKGGVGTLAGRKETFTLVKESEVTLPADIKGFSIFAYGGKAEGVSIKGSLYDVENAEFTPFFPLGVSNKPNSETVKVGVKKGYLLIVYNI